MGEVDGRGRAGGDDGTRPGGGDDTMPKRGKLMHEAERGKVVIRGQGGKLMDEAERGKVIIRCRAWG